MGENDIDDEVKRDTIVVRVKSKQPQRAILFVDYAPDVDPAKKRRKDVRSHAATASAAKRKATIAKKQAQQRLSQILELGIPVDMNAVSLVTRSAPPTAAAPSSNAFKQLVELVTELQGDRVWYLGPIERSSLAHKALRSILWDAMINSPTLLQAAGLVAATYCNSCGLPSTAVHMGSGLLILRGASFKAVQNTIASTDIHSDSLTPVSIAMLAGWERKFGDPESFQVHMQAWRSLSLPQKALEENHVSTLTELTLETFRESLDRRSESSVAGFRITKSPQSISDLPTLPPGFKVFNIRVPETRSLLDLVSQLTRINPHSADEVLQLRKMGLEILAWSPHHTHSIAPSPVHEEVWDQAELNALYHVRAALIGLNSLTTKIVTDLHRSTWNFDVRGAVAVHTASCQHLNTDALLDTRFQEIAIWARFILCAVSRDPPRDALIKRYLRVLHLSTWDQMEEMLRRYIYFEPLCAAPSTAFFELLTMYDSSD